MIGVRISVQLLGIQLKDGLHRDQYSRMSCGRTDPFRQRESSCDRRVRQECYLNSAKSQWLV